jgi:hypothetical protein
MLASNPSASDANGRRPDRPLSSLVEADTMLIKAFGALFLWD